MASYLQDGAPLRGAAGVLARLEHPEGDAVQEDDQHTDVLEPGGSKELRKPTGWWHSTPPPQNRQKVQQRRLAGLASVRAGGDPDLPAGIKSALGPDFLSAV